MHLWAYEALWAAMPTRRAKIAAKLDLIHRETFVEGLPIIVSSQPTHLQKGFSFEIHKSLLLYAIRIKVASSYDSYSLRFNVCRDKEECPVRKAVINNGTC